MPLSYVIIKDTSSPKYSEKRDVQIIYQASLVGNMFTRDSRKVIDIIKELTLGTDAETWIKGLKYGRKVMQELQAHYDGKSEVARRKQVSRADLKKISYKNENTFTFEKYVTKLKDIFNVLEKYSVPLYKDQMVEHLLDHIMSPNTELNTEVTIFRSPHSSTFVKASTYLSTVVTRLYPYSNPSSGRFINRSIYAAGRGDLGSGRCGLFNIRGHGRGRGGRCGRARGVNFLVSFESSANSESSK